MTLPEDVKAQARALVAGMVDEALAEALVKLVPTGLGGFLTEQVRAMGLGPKLVAVVEVLLERLMEQNVVVLAETLEIRDERPQEPAGPRMSRPTLPRD